MRNAAVVALLFPLLVAAEIHADSTVAPTPSATPATRNLLTLMEEAEQKVEKDAPSFERPSQPNDAVSPPPAETSARELLGKLTKEVKELRSKQVITEAAALSTQRPRPAKRIGNRTIYSFKDGDVYEVYAALDHVTDIQLQTGEVLSNAPIAGDTVRWKVGIVRSGTGRDEAVHIILKPLDVDLETNFIFTSNKRVYHLRAFSGDWYMPSISWNYPQDEAEIMESFAKRKDEIEEVSAAPEKLRFDYDLEGGEYAWRPTRVFDDGEKTYFQMPAGLKTSEAPALFIIEDGEPQLVNYRIKGLYYIVDRIFERAQLRVGPEKRVDIYAPGAKPSLFGRLFP